MITNIVVHPKGATHFQKFKGASDTYFLKLVDDVWMFRKLKGLSVWLVDDILNHPKDGLYHYSHQELKPIR